MRIDSISPLQTAGNRIQRPAAEGEDFAKMLTDALSEVNDAQLKSQEVQQKVTAGRSVDPHELVITMERASIALELTMQIRNKLVEAYQEISRTQV